MISTQHGAIWSSANGEPATDDSVPTDTVTAQRPPSSNDEVLARLEQIHAQFAAEELDFEAFEGAKEALLAQLATD